MVVGVCSKLPLACRQGCEATYEKAGIGDMWPSWSRYPYLLTSRA